MLYLGACLAIVAVDFLYLELGVDAFLTRWVVARRGADFTPFVHGVVEGDAVARLQAALAWTPLTAVLGTIYIAVFPCFVLAPILVFDRLRDRRGLVMLLAGYALNFAAVLPFYMLVPVRETWVYYAESGLADPGVRCLLDDLHPAVMEKFRAMSGVDNCFPSFHTSLAVTMALVARHTRRKPFAALLTALAAANVFSTLYLGIHWLTDVAAGLLLGLLAYLAARRVARRANPV
jgi:membrane-associated phospholipid phosphatase